MDSLPLQRPLRRRQLPGRGHQPTDDWDTEYYGQIVSPIDIIVRGSFRNPGAKRLLETVENAT